ncbi:MAG: LPS-assembly protein LptD [Saprospiraceae bacterium]|nr:LPS-assembly protein LptD [Saprospiraceae bacterium]
MGKIPGGAFVTSEGEYCSIRPFRQVGTARHNIFSMKWWVHCTVLLMAIAPLYVFGQVDTGKANLQIIHADVFRFERTGLREVQYLSHDVLVRHRTTYLLCDSAVIDSNTVVAMGRVRIVEGDSLQLFGDSLYYDGQERVADLTGGVVLKHREQQFFTEALHYDLKTRVAHFSTGGMLLSDEARLKSKKGYYHASTGQAFFKDSVVVLLRDSMTLISDTLLYETRLRQVIFKGPTLIEQDSLQIFCDEGYYRIDAQEAHFGNFPKYANGSQRARARSIYHDAGRRVVTLIGEAYLRDDRQEAWADSISLNELSGDVRLFGNAEYVEGARILRGQQIEYNRRTKSLRVRGQPKVLESGRWIQARALDYDGGRDLGIATGAVVVSDSADGYSIVCDSFSYNKKDKRFFAAGWSRRPYIALRFEEDSLYLAADTLLSQRQVTPTDSFQQIHAWGNVKILHRSWRGRCDSLYFSGIDSSFLLFGRPVLWADSSQLTGDTVQLVLEHKALKDLLLYPGAFIINRELAGVDNQIKGRTVHARFAEKRMRTLEVAGNAESLYFIRDDASGFVGANVIQCSQMEFVFNDERKIRHIDFFTKPTGTMLPVQEGLLRKLEGYLPRYGERPDTLESIVAWP